MEKLKVNAEFCWEASKYELTWETRHRWENNIKRIVGK
jgi:hypothetical protein